MNDTITVLSTQHQDVLRELAAAEADLGQGDGTSLAGLVRFLQGDVLRHFVVEEEALFPVLARHIGSAQGPLAVMHAEHAEFRRLLGALDRAVNAQDVPQQHAHAAQLIELLRGHIAKEDNVLFPMALRMLSEPLNPARGSRRALPDLLPQ